MTACALAGLEVRAEAQNEVIWTHASSSGGENWNAKVVSIGNHGTEVFSAFGPFTDYSRLFSVFDQSTPTPVWQDDAGTVTQRHRVASSKEANVHVSLYDIDSGGSFNTRNVVVRKYTSSTGTPDWEYIFPEVTNGHKATDVHATANGERIVAVMHNIYQNETDIAVFSPDSGVPAMFYSVNLATPMVATLLSADGSTLYLRSSAKVVLFDLNTGATRYESIIFGGTPYDDAISGDGSVFAYSTYTQVKLYREVAGYFGDPEIITLPGDNYCSQLDLSDDGRVFGMAFNYYDEWLRVRVQARDLETDAILLDEDVIGSGTFQNFASALQLTPDGEFLALGIWGDEDDLAAEASVYSTSTGIQIASFHTEGSVNALDLSSDGSKLAVASKKTHANIVASGGQIEVFQIGAQDFSMTGVPHVGATVEFTFEAGAGKVASLLQANALASTPTLFPGVGSLFLDSNQFSSSPMGIVGNDDSISSDLLIPNNVALIGSTLYFQGFASTPRELSDSWVTMTVVP